MTSRPVVWLHVGAPKTGTTFLQRVMRAHPDELRASGVAFPGDVRAHFWASLDLRETGFRGHHDPHVPGAWGRLVADVRRWGRTTVIDHESFGQAGPDKIDRALGDLDFADVHLVLTARDLARQLPAGWQERVKNGSTETFADFLASLQVTGADRSSSARTFWNSHGVLRLLARWSRTLPPERVHVVTVPPAGTDPAVLWQRFAGLIGLDAGRYETAGSVANTSLGAAEIAVLRRFNEASAGLDIPWPVYSALLKHQVAPALGARRGPRIEVPQPVFDWTLDWSHGLVDGLVSAGYDVVGDLADLVPSTRPTGADPDDPPADDLAGAALDAMVGMVGLALEGRTAEAALRRAQRGPLARRVEELSRRSPAADRMRAAYRRRQGSE